MHHISTWEIPGATTGPHSSGSAVSLVDFPGPLGWGLKGTEMTAETCLLQEDPTLCLVLGGRKWPPPFAHQVAFSTPAPTPGLGLSLILKEEFREHAFFSFLLSSHHPYPVKKTKTKKHHKNSLNVTGNSG